MKYKQSSEIDVKGPLFLSLSIFTSICIDVRVCVDDYHLFCRCRDFSCSLASVRVR